MLLIGIVSAAPSLPHAFRGSAEDIDGNPIPDGYIITARLDEQGFSTSSIVKDGKYGYDDPLLVSDNDGSGEKVYFYINDKLVETEPADFVIGEITELDLIVDSPPVDFQCGDGICDINTNECSSCLIDCNIIDENVCEDNGVCDSLIGETCSNYPSDCGVCTTTNTDVDTGGSSGGNGGNDGGTITTTTTETTDTTQEDDEESDLGILETSITTSDEDKGFIAGITGAVVGTLGTGGTISVSVLILGIVGAFAFVKIRKIRAK